MSQQVGTGRLAIIAGNGKLPLYVAEAARDKGERPFVFVVENESTLDWSGFDHVSINIGNIALFKKRATELGVDRVILSGGISRRPPFRDMRLGLSDLLMLPTVFRQLIGGGDNAVLTGVIGLIENEGRKVIGAHDVVPSLLAEFGPVGKVGPNKDALQDIAVAVQAARMIGTLDIGQGAVAVGGRVVALEGPEGTDAMLARVAELKQAGRVSARRRGVLVKLCKPQQDLRVDLPSAGMSTVRNAHAAGLAGVALEAGRSLLLDADEVRAFIDEHDMFVTGIDPEQTGSDQ